MLTGYEIWNCVEGLATKVAAGGRKKVNPGSAVFHSRPVSTEFKIRIVIDGVSRLEGSMQTGTERLPHYGQC